MEVLKSVIQFLFSLAVLFLGLGYLVQLWMYGSSGIFDEILKQHFLVSVGIPFAMMAAATLVAIFEIQSGEIDFKGFGLNFSGSAGQIVMWVICFLSIISALKLLW